MSPAPRPQLAAAFAAAALLASAALLVAHAASAETAQGPEPEPAPPTPARCAAQLASSDPATVATGHECRAMLELQGAPSPEDVESALAELSRAEALAPHRREVHQLRLLALLRGERLDELLPALRQGIAASGGAPSDWLGVSSELFLRGLAEESLAAARVVEKRWPRDPEVLASAGAALAVLERDDEALIYLRAAADGAPDDAEIRWNLARLLAYMGRADEAAAHFSAWSALEQDQGRLVRNSCIFAGFVEKQLGDRARACMLQQEFCPEAARSACAPLPAPPKEPAP